MKDYNDEEFINNLADQYVETRDNDLKMEILKAFDPYFKKYAYLLCTQRPIDTTNKDTIKFLRLFMSDEDRATPESLSSAAKRTVSYLRNLFKDCESGDIYDEMVCSFLKQLGRYKPMIASNTPHKKRISFTHFVQVNVRYDMKFIAAMRAKDAMQCPYNLEFNDEINNLSVDPGAPVDWTTIDLKWVYGDTTGNIFVHLDDYERYLLYLKYQDEDEKPLSDYDIARLTGKDRMGIRRKMLKITEKLKALRDK